MSELRLGVEIGFKKISVALYENGVPRVIFSFPSSAACSIDRSEWHFGMNAGSFLADTHYQHVPSVKYALLSHNDGRKNPLVPLLLEQLFAHIKMIGEKKLKQCLRGVVIVLPQCLNCSPVNRQMVMDAWQKNGIMDVLCISDVSAILLAYTVQTLDRRSIITNASDPFYLLVCNADSERCRVDFFVVISNNYVIKVHNNCVLWGCFADLRRRVVAAIYEQLLSAGMPEVNQRAWAQLEEECWSQMAVFDDSLTDKVTIRAPFHQYAVTCTRGMYHAVAAPVIDAIRQHVVSELGQCGIIDANTGNINGKIELLLVGENSRLRLLRTALENVTKSQVVAGVANYVDDAEAFGAAIASSLAGNRGNTLTNHLLLHLPEGITFNMEKILTALPLHHANTDLAHSGWNRFIGHRHDYSLTGDLYLGYRFIPVFIPGSHLILSSPKSGSCRGHCISLECSVNGHPVTFMRMLLVKDVRISSYKERDGEGVLIQASFTHRESGGWSTLRFFPDDADAHKLEPFLKEYDVRKRENQTLEAFTSAADAENRLPNLDWPSSFSFVALVSDHLPTKHALRMLKIPPHPSIVTVHQCFEHGLVVVVQQCQAVTGRLQVMGNTFSIEQPHKIRRASWKGDTVDIEVTPQAYVRVSFPDGFDCRDFLLNCFFFRSGRATCVWDR